MDVSAHKNRARSLMGRSQSVSSPITLSQQRSAGELELESATVKPDNVLPNGTVTVTVAVKETAEFIAPFDPDLCNPGGIASSGLNARITVDPDWTDPQEKVECVPMWSTTAGRAEVQFRFTAPHATQTERHTVTIELRTAGSDKGPAHVDKSITVTGSNQGGEEGCQTNDDCPSGTYCHAGACVPDDGGGGGGGGGGGAMLPCFLDPNRSCAGPETFAWVGLILIVMTAAVLT